MYIFVKVSTCRAVTSCWWHVEGTRRRTWSPLLSIATAPPSWWRAWAPAELRKSLPCLFVYLNLPGLITHNGLQHAAVGKSWQALPIGVGGSCGFWQKWIHQLPSCEVGGKISVIQCLLRCIALPRCFFQVELLQTSPRFKEQREVGALLLFHPPISLLCFCPGNLLDCDVEGHKDIDVMKCLWAHNIKAHFWSSLAGLGCWAVPIDLLLAHAPVWGGRWIANMIMLRHFWYFGVVRVLK